MPLYANVAHPVTPRHDGTVGVGDTITLDADEAAPYVAAGVLVEIAAAPDPKPSTATPKGAAAIEGTPE